MKKTILSATMLLALAFTAQAQDISKNALGLRIGNNHGFGAEISYQRALSKKNRIEGDLGWESGKNVDAFKLTGLYQWVWDIDDDFNWYAGVGGDIGSWSYNFYGLSDSGFFAHVAGDVGIEYGFKGVPLLLSLDARPEIGSAYVNYSSFGFGLALGIKYQF